MEEVTDRTSNKTIKDEVEIFGNPNGCKEREEKFESESESEEKEGSVTEKEYHTAQPHQKSEHV